MYFFTSLKLFPFVYRLYEIQMTTTQQEPIYEQKGEVQVSDNLGRHYKEFLMEVRVGDMRAEGSGKTIKEARREASTEMLRILGYSV